MSGERVPKEVNSRCPHNGNMSHKTETEAKGGGQSCGSDPGCCERTNLLTEPRVRAIVCVYGVFSVRGAILVLILPRTHCGYPKCFSVGSRTVAGS